MSDTTVTTGSESVEDRILSNIGELPDDNTPEPVQPGSATPSEPTVTQTPGSTPGEPVVVGTTPTGGPKPGTQQPQKQEPEDPSVAISQDPNPQPRLKQDDKNNLVNANGTVVAHAGRERRYYERSEQLAVKNQQLNNVINSLNAEVAQLKQNTTNIQPISQHMQTHGVTEQDLPTALQFYATINRDPIDAIKRIVAHAESRGHNVRQALELQGGGGVDLSAINTMIEQKLAPLLQT